MPENKESTEIKYYVINVNSLLLKEFQTLEEANEFLSNTYSNSNISLLENVRVVEGRMLEVETIVKIKPPAGLPKISTEDYFEVGDLVKLTEVGGISFMAWKG